MSVTRPSGPTGHDGDTSLFDWGLVWHIALFILRAPLRHRGVAIGSVLVMASLAVVMLLFFPFQYRSDAVVLARPNPLTGALSTSVNRELDTPTRFARENLIRRENLTLLAANIDLVERYMEKRPLLVRVKQGLIEELTGKELTHDQRLNGLVETLEDELVVDVRNDTVLISFRWWDPEIAFEVVQGAMQSFLDGRHASEVRTIGEAISILEARRSELEGDIDEQITKLEEQLKRGQSQANAPRVEVAAPAGSDRELARLTSTLEARKQAASDLEAFRRQRVAQMQAEFVQQESMYAPDHPTLAGTRRALATLSSPSPQARDLAVEIEELERQIGLRRAKSAAPATNIPRRAQLVREGYVDQGPRAEFELRQLDLLLDQHWNVMNRINAARLELGTAKASFEQRYSVMAPPQVPIRPVKPYRVMILVGGVIGGIALAIFASVVLDLRRGLVLEPWQVERQLALPVLAKIPRS